MSGTESHFWKKCVIHELFSTLVSNMIMITMKRDTDKITNFIYVIESKTVLMRE